MVKKLKETIPVMMDDVNREAKVTLDPDEGYVILILTTVTERKLSLIGILSSNLPER